MANVTFTAETVPSADLGGPGCRWYKPSTHEWRTYNPSTGQWDIDQDGFDSLRVADLAISSSVTVGGVEGITGEYEGTFKKIKIVNGVITEFELEE